MNSKSATLYRMVKPDHLCPYGIKAKALLERQGYAVEDSHLTNAADTEAFRAEHQVATTPQAWIDGVRIGGYDDLRRHFGLSVPDPNATSYRPVVAIFSVAALVAMAFGWRLWGGLAPLQVVVQTVEWFVALSMCLLAVQKLQNVENFSTMFLGYDLLAKRWVGYAYLYPYAEALAGVLMLAGALTLLAAPISLFIGGVGMVSIIKAVYVDKRELKCACVGGDSNVPLGFVSLTESILMVLMGVWMLAKTL